MELFQVIHHRERRAPFLLTSQSGISPDKDLHLPKQCLFVQSIIIDALKTVHCDTSRFSRQLYLQTGLFLGHPIIFRRKRFGSKRNG